MTRSNMEISYTEISPEVLVNRNNELITLLEIPCHKERADRLKRELAEVSFEIMQRVRAGELDIEMTD